MNQHTSTRRRLFNQHDVHAAGLTDTLPELDDAGEGVDDEKASPRGPSHKQAAVIRSKIESAVNGAAGDNGRSVCVLLGSGAIAERRGHLDRRNGRAVTLAGPWI